MGKISKLVLALSIILCAVGFVGIVFCEAPSWSKAVMFAGGLLFLLWVILLFVNAVKKGHQVNNMRVEEKVQQLNIERKAKNSEYARLCQFAAETIKTANKPNVCNTVRLMNEPFLFQKMKSYQYFTDWEIWRNNDKLYLYKAEVENYPENCFDGEAPAIGVISTDDIQYFAVEGSVKSETVVSGGVVKQDKRTGKVSQTALKSKAIERDERSVKMSLVIDGIVQKLYFDKDSYDVLLALIPEKEKTI